MRPIVLTFTIILTAFCYLSCAGNKSSQKDKSDILIANDSQSSNETEFRGRIIKFPARKIAQGLGNITIDFDYPRGYHFTDEAPSQLEWRSSNGRALSFGDEAIRGIVKKIEFPYHIQVESVKGETELVVDASVFFCADKSGICFFDNIRIIVPIKVSKDGSHKLTFNVDIEAPDDFR